MALESLKLADYSDRELLLMIDDVASANDGGFASSGDIAMALGLTSKRGPSCVGSRLGVLRRFGAVYADPESYSKPQMSWALTDLGRSLAFGRLDKQREKAFNDARPEESILLTRRLAEMQRASDETARHLMRREWQRITYLLNGRS